MKDRKKAYAIRWIKKETENLSLILLIIAGFRKGGLRGTGILAAAALIMMMVGAIGQGAVPTQYFGIVERFSVFAAVGFNAVLGVYLFKGFGER